MNNHFDELLQVGFADSALVKIYEGVKHTEIAEEFILPDYLPDIKRIIKAEAKPKIDGKFITPGKIDFEGEVTCHIIFCDDQNNVKNVSFTSVFSDNIELPVLEDECIANLVPSPQSLNCRLINPRRVAVRLRLDTDSAVWINTQFSPVIDGVLSDKEIQKKHIQLPVIKLVCSGESGLTAAADVEADGALPQIGEVISCNVEIGFYECKCSEGKVLCRGDMPVTVFYSTPAEEGESYTVLYRKLPIAQVVAADGVDDTYDCMARGHVEDVKVNISENGFGEKRILEFDVTYRVYLNCVGRDTVNLTEDIYATDRSVVTNTKKHVFSRFARNYSTVFNANHVDDKKTLGIEGADAVYEVTAHPRVEDVKLEKENRKLHVYGTTPTTAVVHGKDGLYSTEYDFPFHLELDASGVPENFTYNCDITCMSSKGRMDNDKLYCELELQANLMVLENMEVNVLESASFFELPDTQAKPQMRFFYPTSQENLWDVGKLFGVSQNELMASNDINSPSKIPPILFIPNKK